MSINADRLDLVVHPSSVDDSGLAWTFLDEAWDPTPIRGSLVPAATTAPAARANRPPVSETATFRYDLPPTFSPRCTVGRSRLVVDLTRHTRMTTSPGTSG